MDDWEEKFYQLCCSYQALYYKRAVLISEMEIEKAKTFDEPIKILTDDIKQWLRKNE